jgi:YtkA-like
MKRFGFALLSCAIAVALSACGKAATPTPLAQTVGAWTATLSIVPNPPKSMGDATLELSLRDAQGQPVSGAEVRFDLTMPGMGMPPNQPVASEVGDGLYRARTIFTMAGKWLITADVSLQGTSERFAFPTHTG